MTKAKLPLDSCEDSPLLPVQILVGNEPLVDADRLVFGIYIVPAQAQEFAAGDSRFHHQHNGNSVQVRFGEGMPEGRENTLSQMTELVVQCYNHPSIVCLGLSNEITATTEVTEDMADNHRVLNSLCHRLDSTRPTTMAHVFMLSPDDPFVMLPDIRSYNLYYGWYVGDSGQNGQWFDDFHAKHPDAVIGLSEYGADGRDEGGKPGQNQKGLITFDRKIKKDAF